MHFYNAPPSPRPVVPKVCVTTPWGVTKYSLGSRRLKASRPSEAWPGPFSVKLDVCFRRLRQAF